MVDLGARLETKEHSDFSWKIKTPDLVCIGVRLLAPLTDSILTHYYCMQVGLWADYETNV